MNQPMQEVLGIAAASGIDRIQLHGAESPEDCGACPGKVLKRIDIAPGDDVDSLREKCAAYPHCDLLLDPGAGDGQTFDFALTRSIGRPFVLAGGLNPANVGAAMRASRPAGVDVSSGVESAPGCKSESAVRQFVAAVREFDVQLHA